jgi:4-hydroxy-3-polyprenylbenzoate decarboxylase
VGLCVSDAGAQVVSHELLEAGPRPPDDPALTVRAFVDRFARPEGTVTVLGLNDLTAPFASGSSLAPAALVAPCSGSTLAAIAHGTSRNLIQRCADVMLKERRRLVLMTRETPLSLIAIENMAAVTRAGAVVMPAMPGFYGLPRSVDDLVDFMVAKALDHLGVPNELLARWGE